MPITDQSLVSETELAGGADPAAAQREIDDVPDLTFGEYLLLLTHSTLAGMGTRQSWGDEALHRFAVTQRELFRNLKQLPGTPAGPGWLSTKDIRIRSITHRRFMKYSRQNAAWPTNQ